MSVDLEEALPPTSAEGTARKPAKAGGPTSPTPPKQRKSRKKSQQGKFSQLVVEIIRKLGERGGSSPARIYAEASKVAWFDQQNSPTYHKYSIPAQVQNDTLLQVKGTGANASFKLNRKKLEGGAERRGAPPAVNPAAKAPEAREAPSGARADRRPAGPTKPSERFVAIGDIEEVEKFLVHGKEVVEWTDQKDWTTLHYASTFGHSVVLKHLLQTRCAVNPRDNKGATPLIKNEMILLLFAMKENRLKLAEILIYNGADVHTYDFLGRGWRDGLAVKSANHSYRGPGFDPQHPHGG